MFCLHIYSRCVEPTEIRKAVGSFGAGLTVMVVNHHVGSNLCILQEQKVVKSSCSEPHSRFSSLRSTTVKHGGQFSFSSSLTHYFSNNNECLWVRLLVLPPLFYPRLPSWGSYQLSQLLSVWLGSWFFLRYNSQWITWLVILSLLLFFLFALLTHDWQMSRRNLLGADWEITYLIVLSLGK